MAMKTTETELMKKTLNDLSLKNIKEGLEAISGILQVGYVVWRALKDGVQWHDIKPIVKEIQDEKKDIIEGAEVLPYLKSEITKIGMGNAFEVVQMITEQYNEFLAVVNKK